MTPSNWRQRVSDVYDRHPRLFEVAFWLFFAGFFWTLGALVMFREYVATDRWVPTLELVTNEASSAVAALLLIPLVGKWLTRFPPTIDRWARSLGGHVLGAVLFSLGHVGLMMVLRSLTYWSIGRVYDHAVGSGVTGVLAMLLYELGKDVPLYLAIVLIIWLYRRWRDARLEQSASGPGHLLASLGQKQVRVYVPDISSIQSAGNYVSLFVDGRELLVRETLAMMERRLEGVGFIRVHRSHIVNLDHVESLGAAGGGRSVITLKDGAQVPLSRSYRQRFRERFGPS